MSGFRLAVLGLSCLGVPAGRLAAADTPGLPGDIVINEFLALNRTGRVDSLGNRSDWIELYNQTGSSKDLTGWYLTDKADTLTKWVLPAATIPANGYLVVVADSSSTPVVNGELHASFALSGSGEYLALVWTNGLTIADHYAPAFPMQSDDISYGIMADRVTRGYFAAPTPGGVNGTQGCAGFADPPQFSRDRCVFTNGFDLSLSTAAGGVIRYTTNGTLPTAASTLYTGPIAITQSVRIRARAYEALKLESPIATRSYIKAAPDLRTFSSDLPILLLDSFGSSIPGTDDDGMAEAHAVIIDTSQGEAGGRADALGVPDFEGRCGVRIRGRSSAAYAKKQYKVETWDELNGDRDVAILGMPAESDWVINGPYDDKTLMRNYLTYRWWEKIGRYAVRTRFVEVFLNAGGSGEMSFESHYLGVYVFSESVKGSERRVGSGEPESTTNPAEITGGFLVEMGNGDSGDFWTAASGRAVWYAYSDPAVSDLNTAQQDWMRSTIATFETALYAADFADPASGYAKYTDVASQVDYQIFREFTRNFDGGSTYFYVNRGGRLTMGPLWDYNMALGNCNYAEGGDVPAWHTEGWNRSYTANCNGWAPWWRRFDEDPDYRQLFVDRWSSLREGCLSTSNLVSDVAATANLLAEAQARNFTRWPVLGTYIWANPPGYQERVTYGQEVEWMKEWLSGRCAWIDAQFLPRPGLSQPGGLVLPGFSLALAGAPGVTVYYTLDGSDPRASGGGFSPGALKYVAPLVLWEDVTVRARAYNSAWTDDEGAGLPWSGLAQASFSTATAANTVHHVPYKESFETYALGSTLVGMEGWYAACAEAAVVETNRCAAVAPGGYPLPGPHEQSLSFSGSVSNLFEQTGSLSNVCVDMLLTCRPGASEGIPVPSPETQVAFWVSGDQRFVLMWHGQIGSTNRWTELTDTPLASNACVRLTVVADYGGSRQGPFGFRVWIDREPVTCPAAWYAAANTNRTFFSGIGLEGEGQVDDLVVDSYNSMLFRRITAAAGPHGTAVPAGELFVPVGASTNIVLLPDPFYGVGAVRVDGQSAGPVLNYAFTNVWDEHTLQADFLAKLTASGVPEVWLNRINPAWTNHFDEHELADSDGDRVNNAQEFVAGTDATNSQSLFRLAIGRGDRAPVVSFPTVPAGGFYGLGGIRRYALEQAEDLAAGNWQGVAGLTNVAGEGQSVVYTNRTEAVPRSFFRGRVWLEP